MPWNEELINHYQRPRNWGSFHHREEGIILTGIDECLPYHDFFGIQIKIMIVDCPICKLSGKAPSAAPNSEDIEFVNCDFCHGFGNYYIVEEVRHTAVGCGWLIAVGSWLSEYLICKRAEEVLSLTATEIINRTGLPWAATHCASIARRAIHDALIPGFGCLVK